MDCEPSSGQGSAYSFPRTAKKTSGFLAVNTDFRACAVLLGRCRVALAAADIIAALVAACTVLEAFVEAAFAVVAIPQLDGQNASFWMMHEHLDIVAAC